MTRPSSHLFTRLDHPHPHARSWALSFSTASLSLLMNTVIAPKAVAEEVPEVFTPVRAVGMGGAFTAVANDENAVWTNPAGIGRARKARSRGTFHVLRAPNIFFGANSTSRNFYKTYMNSTEENISDVVADADDLTEEPLWVRAGLFPVTLLDAAPQAPMAFGIYSNTTLKAVVDKETNEARLEAISDNSAVVTFGYTNQSNRFNIGLQIRPVTRYAYEDRLPAETLRDRGVMKTRARDKANKTTGLGVDFGAMMTLADFWFPTVGVSILNLPTGCKKEYLNPFTEKRETVCGNAYHGDIPNPDALSTIDPTDFRIGASIMPRISHKVSMRFALDAHHLPIALAGSHYGLSGIEASKLIHAGAELHFGNPLLASPFAVRTGYSQGFLTFGASVNVGWMVLDFATYGRDVASGSSPIEDRRYLGQLAFGF